MKTKLSLFTICFALFINVSAQFNKANTSTNKTIFAYGGDVNKKFISYIITLTGKENPKICFLPTATGDRDSYIVKWYDLCKDLPMAPYVQKMFINSSSTSKSFEETLLSMDAIVVGGGNTLNMLAIWKAQGVDTILQKAYNKGIILAGGSAGGMCWFNTTYTDSRPQKLSKIECLNFINASFCPHYNSEESRRPTYHKSILTKDQLPGYACDEDAGILFINEKPVKSVATNEKDKSYFVTLKDGKIVEEKMEVEIIK
jgi:peptidase E